jgi:hypothetical protein
LSYSLTYAEISRHVARYLGYDSSNLNARQVQDVSDIINSGYRRFLDPPMTVAGSMPHVWSFLRVFATIDTVVDQQEYPLPNDFAALETDFTFQEPTSLWKAPIKQIPDARFRKLSQVETSVAYPSYYVIRWVETAGVMVPSIFFWPIPTEIYILEYSYRVLKLPLSGTMIPLGGDVHSQTVLTAALSAAEQLMEENEGIHEKAFQERIRTSISHDLRFSPRIYGYMGDGEMRDGRRRVINITHENQP